MATWQQLFGDLKQAVILLFDLFGIHAIAELKNKFST
jgi:hypothetical protein